MPVRVEAHAMLFVLIIVCGMTGFLVISYILFLFVPEWAVVDALPCSDAWTCYMRACGKRRRSNRDRERTNTDETTMFGVKED